MRREPAANSRRCDNVTVQVDKEGAHRCTRSFFLITDSRQHTVSGLEGSAAGLDPAPR